MSGLNQLLRGLNSLALDMSQTLADVVSGKCGEEESKRRIAICMYCVECDTNGQRLPRNIPVAGMGNLMFCGAPRWKGMARDSVADGCGCCLNAKVRCQGARCPRGRW